LFYFIAAEITLQYNDPALKYFHAAARACKIIGAFILFYFIADVHTCAINAAIYFIAAFIFILLHMKPHH